MNRLLLFGLIFLLACTEGDNMLPPETTAAQAVYLATFDDEVIVAREAIVVRESADISRYYTPTTAQLPALRPDTLINFSLSNKAETLQPIELKDPRIHLLNQGEVDTYFVGVDGFDDGWQNVRRAYPKSAGIINFSQVGFSNDGSQALVYVDFSSGRLRGKGHYVLLEQIDNAWVVIESTMIWIA